MKSGVDAKPLSTKFGLLSKLLGTVKVLLKSESLLKSNILKQACSIKWHQASIWKPTKLKLKSANLIFQKGAYGPEKLILIYIRKLKTIRLSWNFESVSGQLEYPDGGLVPFYSQGPFIIRHLIDYKYMLKYYKHFDCTTPWVLTVEVLANIDNCCRVNMCNCNFICWFLWAGGNRG